MMSVKVAFLRLVGCSAVFLVVLGVMPAPVAAAPAYTYEYAGVKVAHYVYWDLVPVGGLVSTAGYRRATVWCDVSVDVTQCGLDAVKARYAADLADWTALKEIYGGLPKPTVAGYSAVKAVIPASQVMAKTVTPPPLMQFIALGGVEGLNLDLSGLEFMFGTSQPFAQKAVASQISSDAAARKDAAAWSAAADSSGNAAPCAGGMQWVGTWTGCQPGMTIPVRTVVRTLDDGNRPVMMAPQAPSLPPR